MTTILRRGDKIHLAFGLDSRLSREEAAVESKKNHDFFAKMYGRMGVEVSFSTGSSTLTAPVVVAVFREETDG